ncbi:unnamed protein product [Mytilus edulis]|uniref:C-type lectin domain-containing protein n=1 Tax=Mytilus edulis TaxID=6550 RepID=A0A8S3QIW5_MYTED|nr:unnamed protein product [Mytilus edulis]
MIKPSSVLARRSCYINEGECGGLYQWTESFTSGVTDSWTNSHTSEHCLELSGQRSFKWNDDGSTLPNIETPIPPSTSQTLPNMETPFPPSTVQYLPKETPFPPSTVQPLGVVTNATDSPTTTYVPPPCPKDFLGHSNSCYHAARVKANMARISEGEWQWAITLEKVQYMNWDSGQPNNNDNNEHCMAMTGSRGYKWEDKM